MIIYRIFHKKSDKSYIGQTTRKAFNHRYSGGRWWDVTDNPILKASYKKYGPDAFGVEILEPNADSLEHLNELEEIYAKKFNAYAPNGYNLRECGNNQRLLQHQIKLIQKNRSKSYKLRKIDTWKIIKIFNLKRFCRQNGLTHATMYNMVNKNLGIIVSQGYCLSNRSREEVENRNCRKFKNVSIEIVHESGKRAFVKNVKSFAKNHGLEKGSLYKLLNGKMLFYMGWRLPSRINESKSSEKYFELLSPKGNIIKAIGVAKFCKKHELSYQEIIKVLHGKRLDYRGWRLPSTTKEQIIMKRRRQAIVMDLVDPNGVPFHVENLRIFCHEKQMPYTLFYNLYKGYSRSCLGWTKQGAPRNKYRFTAPNGEKYETIFLKNFCKNHILNYNCICNIIGGHGKSHRGWTVIKN